MVREIGRGGMGAVYLAERADGAFEQQVALKLIKRGMDSEAILRRFQPRQDLATGGHFAEAMPLFEEADRVLRGTVGTGHMLYGTHRMRLGAALRDQGRAEQALAPADEALAILRQQAARNRSLVAWALTHRGRIHLALGHLRWAERDLRQALRMRRELFPGPHDATATTLTHLARTLMQGAQIEQAASLAREGLGMAEATLPAEHEIHAEARAVLAAAGASSRPATPGP